MFMHPLLTKIEAKNDMTLIATFDNGKTKSFDVKPYLDLFEPFKKLTNTKLFENVKVAYGGHAVCWSDEIDLDANDIWEFGEAIN
jgi:hypothetical protein